jgi:hypothetical protein
MVYNTKLVKICIYTSINFNIKFFLVLHTFVGMKRFNSKVSRMIILFPSLIISAVTILMVANKVWIGLIICVAVAWYLADMWSKTYYEIEEDTLVIHAGTFYKISIPISTISKIKPSRDPSKAPAMSMDRLSIRYTIDGKKNEVLVSPENKEEFIQALKEINGNIEFGELYKI